MNYNTHTIRAFARCFGLTREVVYLINLHLASWHRYTLAVACGMMHKPLKMDKPLKMHKPLKHMGVFHQLLLEYTQAGNTSGLNWIGDKYRSGREPDVALSRDDLVTMQWFASNKWITVTDSWMLSAWMLSATKCATWMRDVLARCGINKHLLMLDFTQPYSRKRVEACYTCWH